VQDGARAAGLLGEQVLREEAGALGEPEEDDRVGPPESAPKWGPDCFEGLPEPGLVRLHLRHRACRHHRVGSCLRIVNVLAAAHEHRLVTGLVVPAA
jgi:hypothetical protein